MSDLIDATRLDDAWGLHDAILRGIDWDWVSRTLRLRVTIMLGKRQERCRDGAILVRDVACFIVEPPAEALREPGDEWDIDAGRMDERQWETAPKLPAAPDGHWVNWVYSRQANASLFICAADASFEWTGDEREGTGGALLPGDEIPDPPSTG